VSNFEEKILEAIEEIRDLMRIVAEPAIAERDKTLRAQLRKIVGKGGHKFRAVTLLDGKRTQADISKQTGMSKGALSEFVKALHDAKLLTGDPKKPKIAISIPTNFFNEESARD
jgi:hypothetical protein